MSNYQLLRRPNNGKRLRVLEAIEANLRNDIGIKEVSLQPRSPSVG
jgi:hypothetical protein